MSNPTQIPHPGYKNAKPYIQPVLDLFSELGAQDACLQLQEVSIVHLKKSAQAMSAHMNDYLKLLYISNNIPQGTYSFSDMRAQIYKSFIALTHSVFNKAIKECNSIYQKNNPNNVGNNPQGWCSPTPIRTALLQLHPSGTIEAD